MFADLSGDTKATMATAKKCSIQLNDVVVEDCTCSGRLTYWTTCLVGPVNETHKKRRE